VTWELKAGIVERIHAAIARQLRDILVSAERNKLTTMELPVEVLSSASKLLLILALMVILSSKYQGSHDHILPSDGSGIVQITHPCLLCFPCRDYIRKTKWTSQWVNIQSESAVSSPELHCYRPLPSNDLWANERFYVCCSSSNV
jgi:hypothetical protein